MSKEEVLLNNEDLIIKDKALKRMLLDYEDVRLKRLDIQAIESILSLKRDTLFFCYYLFLLIVSNLIIYDRGYFTIEFFLQNTFNITSVFVVVLMMSSLILMMSCSFLGNIIMSLLLLEFLNGFELINYITGNESLSEVRQLINYSGVCVFILLLYLILTTVNMAFVSYNYNKLKRNNFKTYLLNFKEYELCQSDFNFNRLSDLENILTYSLYSILYHYERLKSSGRLYDIEVYLDEKDREVLKRISKEYKSHEFNIYYIQVKNKLELFELNLSEDEKKDLIDKMEKYGRYNQLIYTPRKRVMRA